MNEELKKDEINLENEYKKMSDSSKFVQQGFWALGVFLGFLLFGHLSYHWMREFHWLEML